MFAGPAIAARNNTQRRRSSIERLDKEQAPRGGRFLAGEQSPAPELGDVRGRSSAGGSRHASDHRARALHPFSELDAATAALQLIVQQLLQEAAEAKQRGQSSDVRHAGEEELPPEMRGSTAVKSDKPQQIARPVPELPSGEVDAAAAQVTRVAAGLSAEQLGRDSQGRPTTAALLHDAMKNGLAAQLRDGPVQQARTGFVAEGVP